MVLERKKLIGEIGEDIAFDYEYKRLKSQSSKFEIDHISKKICNSGYDIHSLTQKGKRLIEERYIEVKSTTQSNNEIFLTENKKNTLRELGKSAYIYLVQITSVEKKQGYVLKEKENPINYFETKKILTPIVYKVKIEEN